MRLQVREWDYSRKCSIGNWIGMSFNLDIIPTKIGCVLICEYLCWQIRIWLCDSYSRKKKLVKFEYIRINYSIDTTNTRSHLLHLSYFFRHWDILWFLPGSEIFLQGQIMPELESLVGLRNNPVRIYFMILNKLYIVTL